MWYNVEYGSVAQLVEQRPEEPCVAGSSPAGTTRRYMKRLFGRFFSGKRLLSTLQVLGCYFAPILHEKCARKHIFTPIKSSVNTLNNLVYDCTKLDYFFINGHDIITIGQIKFNGCRR